MLSCVILVSELLKYAAGGDTTGEFVTLGGSRQAHWEIVNLFHSC